MSAELLREKAPGLIAQLMLADPRLRVLVYYAAGLSIVRFGVVPVLTQVNRDRAGTIALHGPNTGISVHEVHPCRGADLRTRGLLDDVQAQAWEDELDRTVAYVPEGTEPMHTCATFETQSKALALGRDPSLPPVVPHLHLQVPGVIALYPRIQLWT